MLDLFIDIKMKEGILELELVSEFNDFFKGTLGTAYI